MGDFKPLKSYCGRCSQKTNHQVLAEHKISNRGEYDCDIYYQVISCLGCETIVFRENFIDIESAYPTSDNEWEVPEETKIYPKVLHGHRELTESHHIPGMVSELYAEVLTAITEGTRVLAGLGLRGIVEAVCNDLSISGRSLEIRINRLANLGHISKSDAERLHAIRFMGNDAAHETRSPNDAALKVALKIVEHLLQSVYVLEKEVEGRLEPIISKYEKFESLLNLALKNFSIGEELPIAKLLGRDLRRVKESISTLESELIARIESGAFSALSVGKREAFQDSSEPLQHFIVRDAS